MLRVLGCVNARNTLCAIKCVCQKTRRAFYEPSFRYVLGSCPAPWTGWSRHTSCPEGTSVAHETNIYSFRLQERLDNMDAQLQRIFNAVQGMVRNQKPKRPIPKPAVLPITSMEEMVAFNNIGEDIYFEVVRYFKFIGGFHIKEVVNMCLKEAIAEAVTPHFTWWGNERKQAFSKTRLVHAIYEAACDNAHFQSPCRLDFQKHMKEALRTCQERYRSRNRNRQQAVENNRNNRDYWNNNGNNTNTETPEHSTE
ncbi:uncharacterized protein LOC143907447 isoform X2 [Temnothorax americanus]|uniref:uncharacterized protein LOC143907447 isoform X2 n=1 Tax=Temnothorax americanus TaxID=1964332 RepID=UPI0040689839